MDCLTNVNYRKCYPNCPKYVIPKPYLVSRNVIADNKSFNNDYKVSCKSLFNLSHTQRFLLRWIYSATLYKVENSALLKEVITVIPNDKKKSSSYMEIIFAVEGNSQLEFNVANLRATDRNLKLQKA